MIKIILLETNFELLASTEFQSRIYKAASRKRQYLHDTHGKPPPKPSARAARPAVHLPASPYAYVCLQVKMSGRI